MSSAPLVNSQPLNETGALHIAAIMGDLPKIKLLLSFGADVNEIPACTIFGIVKYI